MRVLITGANGFIGQNLQLFLKEKDIEIDKYTLENKPSELEQKLKDADFIVHLAGVNRPQTKEEFFSGNTDLTKNIVDLLNKNNLKTPLIFSSSIQAALDNDYGKSKRLAEDYILENYKNGIVFRLHNVFGKGCRPNYNSVVATFCDNLAHGKPISIDDPERVLELIYIDDICKTFLNLIEGKTKPEKPYNYVSPVKKIKLAKLAELLESFSHDIHSIKVPETGDPFIKKLFSTYISYCNLKDLIFNPKENIDERGLFSELVHTENSGQFSVSTSKPGITRGNHYHHTKIEKFIVIKGEATISMRKVGEEKVHEFKVSGDKIEIVTIPVGYTHNIKNTGKDEMILLIWCNEIFDNNNPDTFYEEV
ncbi:NAD-dependent epimerase/dehydratase family protein [Candidatus Saccharibacteria bacterium]|nr:NAD-dependent epimerase/dehydratase family protein [Candidatus Saccharibacteria bacterium]